MARLETSATKHASRRRLHVLHVDDDDLDALNFQRAIRTSQVFSGVTRARDGVEALALLRSGTIALDHLIVVVDICMPRMNGIELLHELRADPRLASLPVVMMSTSTDGADVSHAWGQHVAGYLVKSGDRDRFKAAIAAFEDYWAHVEMP